MMMMMMMFNERHNICFIRNKEIYVSDVFVNKRDALILVNKLYFFVNWLCVFRAIISPSSGATFNKLYSAIGTCRYSLLNVAPDDGLMIVRNM